MQSLMRVVCIAYLILLTVLLVAVDPLRWIGVRGTAPSMLRWLLPMAHLLSFWLLALLALTARWPAPRWAIGLVLVLYAGLTELGQGFLPWRTAEWGDWLQDVAGIGAAAVVCWVSSMIAGRGATSCLTPRIPSRRNGPIVEDKNFSNLDC